MIQLVVINRVTGNTLNLYIKNGYPAITIGPHLNFSSLLVIFALFIVVLSACINFYIHKYMIIISLLVPAPFFLSFGLVLFQNPGYPILQITKLDIDYVIRNKFTWCKYWKVVQRFKHTVHWLDWGVWVDKLDHHWPWFSKCITQSNIKWFYTTLAGAGIFGAYFWITAVVWLYKLNGQLDDK